jgi:hypothetical protein
VSRFVLIGATVVTCLLAVIANVLVLRMLGINFFTLKKNFIVPAGAFGCGMMGASGAFLAARYFNIRPTVADAPAMMVVAAATMALIYYLDYMTLVFADGRRASDLVDFSTYVDIALTKLNVWTGRVDEMDISALGRWAYALVADEFLGVLAGGATIFGILLELPRCARCEAYLRKLKTKKSPKLTFDEAKGLLEMFRTGDRAAIEEVIGWIAPARRLGVERAVFNFALHGCPVCNAETVIVTVAVYRKKHGDWEELPSLEARRCLAGGRSLRDRFA